MVAMFKNRYTSRSGSSDTPEVSHNFPSDTIANASMSIEDIISRIRRGIPTQVVSVEPVYDHEGKASDEEIQAYSSKHNADELTAMDDLLARQREIQQQADEYRQAIEQASAEPVTNERTNEQVGTSSAEK